VTEGQPPDDLVPVSVRLGTVVPPEDPEDWTRPLTWVAAIGMLVAPVVAAAWFVLASPSGPAAPVNVVLAVSLVVGASLTGATQIGRDRAFAGTLGAGLFGALGVVVAAAVTGGDGTSARPTPPVAHAVAGLTLGLPGVLVAAVGAAFVARGFGRAWRFIAASGAGLATAALIASVLG
jgi:hypothetical protein